jgi:hypothetical protein
MRIFIFVFLSTLFYNPLFAKIPEWKISDENVRYLLTLEGASYALNGRHLRVYIDEENNAAHFNARVKRGFYPATAASDYWILRKNVESNPFIFICYSFLQTNSVIIPKVYLTNPNLDIITVDVYHVHRNDYGNKVSNYFASFKMNKKLNNLVDWEHVNPLSEIDILPDFHLSNYAFSGLAKEGFHA